MLQGLPVKRPRSAIKHPAAVGRIRSHRRFVTMPQNSFSRERSPRLSSHNLIDASAGAGSIHWPLWSIAIFAGLSAWALALSLAGVI